jgi:hypothetical protein
MALQLPLTYVGVSCPARYQRVCQANDQLANELQDAHEVLYELQMAASRATPAVEQEGTRALLLEQQQVGGASHTKAVYLKLLLVSVSMTYHGAR